MRRAQKKRLLDQHQFCCFCGGQKPSTTVEHAPPKAFFRNKHRPSGLEFPACTRCNHGSAGADQVASYLAMAGGLVEGDEAYSAKLLKGIANNTPEVLKLFSFEKDEVMQIRGELRTVCRVKLNPKLAKKWINPWIAKQAFALWFEHTGQPIGRDGLVAVRWLTNDSLFEFGVPEQLRNAVNKDGCLKQGRKQVSDQFLYRYQVSDQEHLGAFLIGAHETSAFAAFVFHKRHRELTSLRKLKFGEIFRTNAKFGIHPVPQFQLSKLKKSIKSD